MMNWIKINPTTGKYVVVNLDRIAYAKWESGMLYFYAEIDGRPSAEKRLAYSDPDRTIYLQLLDIIAKGGD